MLFAQPSTTARLADTLPVFWKLNRLDRVLAAALDVTFYKRATSRKRKENPPMFTWLARRFLDRFEREWSYDMTYARDVLEAGGYQALAPMSGIQKASSYRRDVPADIFFTAKLVAVRSGDCGSCLQLVATMAQREGVPETTIAAVLAGDREAMTEPVAVAYDFTRAVLARDGWDGAAREKLQQRYGKRAMITLAYAIATARFYPDFKYALGAAHACSRVRVGSIDVVPLPV